MCVCVGEEGGMVKAKGDNTLLSNSRKYDGSNGERGTTSHGGTPGKSP